MNMTMAPTVVMELHSHHKPVDLDNQAGASASGDLLMQIEQCHTSCHISLEATTYPSHLMEIQSDLTDLTLVSYRSPCLPGLDKPKWPPLFIS